MKLAHVLSTALVLGVLLEAGRARAGDASMHIESYAVPTGCPSEAAFRSQWERGHMGSADNRPLRLAIGIGPDPRGFRGHVAITPEEGDASVRVVVGATCEEIVSALALIAVLSMDSHAPHEAASPPKAAMPSDLESEKAREVGRPPPARALELGVGMHGGIEGGVAPKPLFALPAFVQLRVSPKQARAGLHFAPLFALRLGFVTASARTVVNRDTSVDMRFTSGRVDVCPFELRAGEASIGPCPGLELGVLEGKEVDVGRSEQRFWASAVVPVQSELLPR